MTGGVESRARGKHRGAEDERGGLNQTVLYDVDADQLHVAASFGEVARDVFVVDHDMSKLEMLTRNVKEMFGDALPAQTLIPVPKLAIDPMLFEVEAVVMLE